jgi:hypothetical protein
VSDISFANSPAECKMGAIVAKEASGCMKNAPTIMICTLFIIITLKKLCEIHGDCYNDL